MHCIVPVASALVCGWGNGAINYDGWLYDKFDLIYIIMLRLPSMIPPVPLLLLLPRIYIYISRRSRFRLHSKPVYARPVSVLVPTTRISGNVHLGYFDTDKQVLFNFIKLWQQIALLVVTQPYRRRRRFCLQLAVICNLHPTNRGPNTEIGVVSLWGINSNRKSSRGHSVSPHSLSTPTP